MALLPPFPRPSAALRPSWAGLILVLALACGGGGGVLGPGSGGNGGGGGGGGDSLGDPGSQGLLNLTLSDAPAEGWAQVGVKVLGVSLTPSGGGTAVPVYAAGAAAAPILSLVQLDRLGQLLARTAVTAGTYSGAVLTLSANAGDVTLVAAADPPAGFPEEARAQVDSARILVPDATGSGTARTLAVPVAFPANLAVPAGGAASLDLELDLGHPAFLVPHPADGQATLWVLNPVGRLRARPNVLPSLALGHLYGVVASVAADGSSLVLGLVGADGASTGRSLTLRTDATPLYFSLPAGTQASFTAALAATLPGKYLRVAAQGLADGSLSAVRLWAGGTFGAVASGAEGHLLHVDPASNQIQVQGSPAAPVPLQVTADTQFFWRAPGSAASAPVGTGTGFLASLARGFKVDAVASGSATPRIARTVDLEAARFDGDLAAAGSAFTVTGRFATASDGYAPTLGFADGFAWWIFPFPDTTSDAAGFLAALGGSVDFGGTVGTLPPRGMVLGSWDPAASAWRAGSAALTPALLPLGTITTGWSAGGVDGSFGLTVAGGAREVTVALNQVTAQVYQVNRSAAGVTVTPTTQNLASALARDQVVRVYGVPGAGGVLQGYVVLYFTGILPSQ